MQTLQGSADEKYSTHTTQQISLSDSPTER